MTASNHDRIAATLGAEILTGVHAPDENLPSEPELLERFKVSRTVMREVMKTLAAKGFVVSKTRIGTRVRDPVNWNLFDADVLAWRVSAGLDAEFVRSLTEIRRAMEPAASALAARRRSSADLAAMRAHVGDMARTDHTRRSFAETDLAFHMAIGVASGNPLMRSMAGVIEAALIMSFTSSSPIDEAKDQRATVRSHAAIVDAIEARDPTRAARATLKVIDIGVRRIAAKSRKRRGKR